MPCTSLEPCDPLLSFICLLLSLCDLIYSLASHAHDIDTLTSVLLLSLKILSTCFFISLIVSSTFGMSMLALTLGVYRRCLSEDEVPSVLHHYHASTYAGHFGLDKTIAKVLQAGFYCLTLFKNARTFVMTCD